MYISVINTQTASERIPRKVPGWQTGEEQKITFLFHLKLFSRQFGYNTLRLVRDSSGKIAK